MAGDRAGRSGGGPDPFKKCSVCGTLYDPELGPCFKCLDTATSVTVGPSGDPGERLRAIRLAELDHWSRTNPYGMAQGIDVRFLLGRIAELERALIDIVDEAGPCDLMRPRSKHSHDIIDRPPCCIERGRAALRAGG